MPVGMLMMVPGGTQELYDDLSTEMFGGLSFGDKAPEGLIAHSAGPAPDGWYVYDIWESPDHFRRFAETQLGPTIQQRAPDMAQPEPQFYEIHNLQVVRTT